MAMVVVRNVSTRGTLMGEVVPKVVIVAQILEHQQETHIVKDNQVTDRSVVVVNKKAQMRYIQTI